MKRALFIVATCYMIFYMFWLFPTFSYGKKYFDDKYKTYENSLAITDIYQKMMTTNRISMWSLVGMYAVFSCSLFLPTRQNKGNN